MKDPLDVRPEDAVSLLLECHLRTREYLALARTIAEADFFDASKVVAAALRVRRYFDRVFPLHARDEDDSILPRLRGKDPVLDEALDAMACDHREHSRTIAALVAACEEIARVPSRRTVLAPFVARATVALERHFDEHLAREEELIFPAMREVLDASASAAIVAEIHRRRVGAGPDVEQYAARPMASCA